MFALIYVIWIITRVWDLWAKDTEATGIEASETKFKKI